MSEVKDELLDHSYDGIQEYDNPLPRWWVGMFYATIAFALFYIPYYATGMGDSPEAAYDKDMEEWNELHPTVTLAGAEEMAKLVADPAKIAEGKKIYDVRCIACHLADGGGLVGPNLTDAFWIHGGAPHEIASTIYHGVPEKGMIPWKSQLSVDEIYAAAAYVVSLQGTTPANPKAPEGTKVEDTGAPAAPAAKDPVADEAANPATDKAENAEEAPAEEAPNDAEDPAKEEEEEAE